MSTYKYKDIVNAAKNIQKNVKNDYELGVTPKWCYYICKAITEIKTKEFEGIKFADAKKVKGDHISRQIFKSSYIDMAERIIRYTEREEHLPATVGFTTLKGKTYRININLATEMFSRILIYYDTNKAYPKYANINSKIFTKPTEKHNEIYEYFVKTFGKIDCIDDALEKIAGNGYGYYYDDVYSCQQTIDRMKNGQGVNCTDSMHVFYNIMLEFIKQGKYKKVECLHILCSGGDGHVRMRVTTNNGDVFYRDPAAVLDSGNITYNWCMNGELIAINPPWFMENLSR